MTASSSQSALHGILLIDKPAGWTSHDVVAKARRVTGQRKIGHTGTLDPMATGLLVLCLGDATRLVEYMSGHDKRYEGTITLGVTTDTDDADGQVVGERPVPELDDSDLERIYEQFSGPIAQRPPSFSAVKVAGKRAYAIARSGGDPHLHAREVVVHSISLHRLGGVELGVTVHCGPGTYIRSLARDIGRVIGCGAHLSKLRRTAVGRFELADAVALERLESAGHADPEELLLAADEGIIEWPAALLQETSAAAFAHGSAVDSAPNSRNVRTLTRVFNGGGAFVGVGEIASSGQLRPIKVMANLAKSMVMSSPDSQKA